MDCALASHWLDPWDSGQLRFRSGSPWPRGNYTSGYPEGRHWRRPPELRGLLPEILEMLRMAGAQLDARNVLGQTPLHLCALKPHRWVRTQAREGGRGRGEGERGGEGREDMGAWLAEGEGRGAGEGGQGGRSRVGGEQGRRKVGRLGRGDVGRRVRLGEGDTIGGLEKGSLSHIPPKCHNHRFCVGMTQSHRTAAYVPC